MANDNSVVVKVGDKVFIKGDQGAVFIPAVDEQGNISWTNDGGLPNPTTRNIMGPEGEKGDTPNFSIGTVTTGIPGSSASASITGTPENPVLNLTIPRGDTGEVTQAEFNTLAGDVAQQKSAIEALTVEELEWDANTTRDLPNVLVQGSYSNWSSVLTSAAEGDTFFVKGSGGYNSRLWIFADSTGASVAASEKQAKTAEYIKLVAPTGTSYLACNSRTNDDGYTPSLLKQGTVGALQDRVNLLDYNLESVVIAPELRNGSVPNTGNNNAVATDFTIPTNGAKKVLIQFGIAFQYGMYLAGRLYSSYVKGQKAQSTDYMIKNYDPFGSDMVAKVTDNSVLLDVSTAEAFSFAIYDSVIPYDGTNVRPLRLTDFPTQIKLVYLYESPVDPVVVELENARWIRRKTATPLTLMHLSDIHADSTTLSRIYAQRLAFGDRIDDAICTGDLVANAGGAISSWWIPEIMTCVGNHDSATYSSGNYNWTAVSMADRDAYYIAPFESNWNVVHTAGTSYYYKDYTTQNVRLIVMDGMLYMGTPGAEATSQTAWLEGLLSDAISNNLHVLIAIHSAHGGAAVKECTFSQLDTFSVAPSHGDCNTPQTVVDAVASAISSGLKFCGYIIGHEHKDFVYDAENDGTQMMYCVTCAASDNAQWFGSDQFRSANLDAYNLVTIDTANTLIKLVRGGGADVDDRGRQRKYICFNYSTGQIVGETT